MAQIFSYLLKRHMMNTDKKKNPGDPRREPAREGTQQEPPQENANVAAAYEEASRDIEADPDLSLHHPNDDLDEGETARLGENKTDLI